MQDVLLAQADRIVASLSPGRREAVREIVIDSVRRGYVDPRARRFLEFVSGSALLGDVLDAAVAGVEERIPTIRELGTVSPDQVQPDAAGRGIERK